MDTLIAKLLLTSHIFSVDLQDLHLQLYAHPEYPSLKAITDTLDYFGIENIAANVPKDALDQLPTHFLALIEKDGNQQLSFIKQQKKNIKVYTEDSSKTITNPLYT